MNEYPELAVSKNYSLTMLHIAKVSDLSVRLGISRGEVVRRAIDLFYQKQEEEEILAAENQSSAS